MRLGTRWVIAGAVVAAVAVQAGVVAVLWATARPKLPAVTAVGGSADAAIAAVVGAAGDGVAVAVSGLVPVTSCQHTLFAHGHVYSRTADLYVDPGGEDALITRIGAGLPAADHPVRGNAVGNRTRPLSASAGPGVRLNVTQVGDGWVAAIAQTDCRATIRTAPTRSDGPVPADAAALYQVLGTSAAGWHTETVGCPGGQIATTDAYSARTGTDGLVARLAAAMPADARRIANPGNRLIWRQGTTSVIVAASDDGTQVTVQRTTTSC